MCHLLVTFFFGGGQKGKFNVTTAAVFNSETVVWSAEFCKEE